MGISKYPSAVSLPRTEKPYPAILDFLAQRFPKVDRSIWEQRMHEGKLLDSAGTPITVDTPYVPQQKIYYFREVADEATIPLAEKILFQDAEILVACKPPFLPVTPSGPYVDECLLHRLKTETANPELVPLHRIDRETSGLVLFSKNKETRGRYAELFLHNQIEKSYEAIAEISRPPEANQWFIENRLTESQPWFRMQEVEGEVNARSRIELLSCKDNLAHFQLSPITGKKHQLRVHMSGLGFPIQNDRYYPELRPEQTDDLVNPLQLIARSLKFIDPVSGKAMEFKSERKLLF